MNNYDKYISKYNELNIKEIELDSNMGPGHARHVGIDRSNNKYIMFIDSDDYFYTNHAVKDLYDLISSKDLDLVVSNFIYKRDDKEEIKKLDSIWLHGKIYNRDFLHKYNINFNDSRQNEDNGFNSLILLLRPKIDNLDDITYVYEDNPNSITRKNNREYKITGLEGYIYNINWAVKEGIKRSCNIDDVIKLLYRVLVAMYFYYLDYKDDRLIKWSKDIYITLIDIIKKDIFDYLKDNDKCRENYSKMMDKKNNEYKNVEKHISFEQFINNIRNI